MVSRDFNLWQITIKMHIKIISYIILFIFILSSTVSCSSSKPKQIYVTKRQLSSFKNVACITLPCKVDVRFFQDPPPSLVSGVALTATPVVGIIPGFALWGIETVNATSKDKGIADSINKTLGENKFEKQLGNYFIESIRESNIFKIEFTSDLNYKILKKERYNSVIEIDIKEITLVRGITNLRLYVKVSCKMIDLRDFSIIWDRVEDTTYNEEYTFEEYTNENCKILRELSDKSLKKLALRLSSDIIYAE